MIEKINVVVVVCSSIANVKERTLLRKKTYERKKGVTQRKNLHQNSSSARAYTCSLKYQSVIVFKIKKNGSSKM